MNDYDKIIAGAKKQGWVVVRDGHLEISSKTLPYSFRASLSRKTLAVEVVTIKHPMMGGRRLVLAHSKEIFDPAKLTAVAEGE